jgi:hypothetical protein
MRANTCEVKDHQSVRVPGRRGPHRPRQRESDAAAESLAVGRLECAHLLSKDLTRARSVEGQGVLKARHDTEQQRDSTWNEQQQAKHEAHGST